MTQELTIKSQNSDRKIAARREDSDSNLNLKAASEIETESQTDRFFYLRSETFLCRLCKTVSRLNRKICFVWLLPVQSLPQFKSTDSSEKTCDANDTEPLKTQDVKSVGMVKEYLTEKQEDQQRILKSLFKPNRT